MATKKAAPKARPKLARKQTSDKLSALAAKILAGGYRPTAAEIRALAACVLGQDEHRGARQSGR